MASEMKGRTIGGFGKIAEIDGGYFGGYIKPANRVDRRLVKNQNGKRQCVVVIRERDGKTLPAVFRTKGEALSSIRNRVATGTEIMANKSYAWNDLGARFAMKRINHQEAYSLADAGTNRPEEFFQPDASG